MKKRFLLALLLLSVFILCGCNSGNHKFDPDDYMIVYSASDGIEVEDAAYALADALGISDTMVASDISYQAANSDSKEIIIGNTNRPASVKYSLSSDILYLDYIIKFEENSFVIFGGSPEATVSAVEHCINNFIPDKKKPRFTDTTYKHAYEVKEFTVDNIPVACYNAVSPDGEYNNLIEQLRTSFTKKTGLRLTNHTHVLNIFIKSDSTLPPNRFSIKVSNSDITISGANSYTLDAAISYFINDVIVSETHLTSNTEFTQEISDNEKSNREFISLRSFPSNSYNRLTKDKKLNVVYFGGSISSGYGASDPAKSWTSLTTGWLKSTFPEAEINAYTSSINASGSMLGAFRCKHDVTDLQPDIVFLEFAVNDLYSDLSVEDADTYFISILNQIRESNPYCDIVVLYAADQNTVRQSNNPISSAAAFQETIAAEYNITSINLNFMLYSDIDYADDEEWKKYFLDIIHPNDAGHQKYFEIIRSYFETSFIYTNSIEPNMVKQEIPQTDFEPIFITADKLEIERNSNWEFVSESYWSSANPYPGYLTPTDTDNRLIINFKGGKHIALFAQYSTSNRLIYQIDDNTERITSQTVNQPLLLNPSFESNTENDTEHSLSMSVRITDHTTPFILTGVLIW